MPFDLRCALCTTPVQQLIAAQQGLGSLIDCLPPIRVLTITRDIISLLYTRVISAVCPTYVTLVFIYPKKDSIAIDHSEAVCHSSTKLHIVVHLRRTKMLSRRATEKNAWFLEQFKRPLARQGSKDASNIDMATAENWLLRPEVLSMLKRNCVAGLREEHLSYASGLGGTSELLESLSRFFNHFFSPSVPVRPEHIVTGTGCSAVLDTLINDICDEGDGLLVTAPMWGE